MSVQTEKPPKLTVRQDERLLAITDMPGEMKPITYRSDDCVHYIKQMHQNK